MENYICIDGVKTKLSCETAESLKRDFAFEKPKELRHGDYGITDCKDFFVWLGADKVLWASGISCTSWSAKEMESWTILGNTFDILERNSIDLEEFEVKWPSGNVALRVRIDNPDSIMIKESGSSGTWMGIKETQEHHQKLGQLIATAKRREAKKDC